MFRTSSLTSESSAVIAVLKRRADDQARCMQFGGALGSARLEAERRRQARTPQARAPDGRSLCMRCRKRVAFQEVSGNTSTRSRCGTRAA
eukprot:2062690-Prymnesium_polylepis.2